MSDIAGLQNRILGDYEEIMRELQVTPRRLRHCIMGAIAEYGLNSCEISILTCLALGNPVNSVKDIGEYIQTPKCMISRAAKNLYRLGYITMREDENDRRVVRLRLEEKAAEITKIIRTRQQKVLSGVLSGVSEDDLDAFRRTARTVLNNIKENYGKV